MDHTVFLILLRAYDSMVRRKQLTKNVGRNNYKSAVFTSIMFIICTSGRTVNVV